MTNHIRKGTGKWAQAGVPRKGWSCIEIDDLGAGNYEICEMCEVREIRYSHVMEHPEYHERLAVGCVCAGHMEEDYLAAKERERKARNKGQRRQNWATRRQWKVSKKGNKYINFNEYNIAIFEKNDGSWGGRIRDNSTGKMLSAKRHYKTEKEIKLATFDAVHSLQDKKGANQ